MNQKLDLEQVNPHYCAKSVRIRSFSGQYFPAFGLNTERYQVSPRIQYKSGKMRTRKTPNTDTFHAVTAPAYFSKKKTVQTSDLAKTKLCYVMLFCR